MFNILIMGGGGFLGMSLCQSLLSQGHNVSSLDRCTTKNDHKLNTGNFKQIIGDYSDHTTIEKSLMNIDVVFHLISTTTPMISNNNAVLDITENVLPTIEFLNITRQSGVKKIIFFSSGGTIYGPTDLIPISEDHACNPICSYGIQKLAIEKYLHLFYKLYNLDYAVMRISNPYGKGQAANTGQGVIATIINRVIQNKHIEIWGDGSVIRDYIYIDDVIEASIKLMHYKGCKKVFNIGSGCGHSLIEVIDEVSNVLKIEPIVEFRDKRNIDVPINVLDVQLANMELEWAPKILLPEGIDKAIKIIYDDFF